MKQLTLIATYIFCCNLVFSQVDDAAKFAGTITMADLKQHLTILAGNEMEGRETGTIGQRKAAEYIEARFKDHGLTTAGSLQGYQQFYSLFKDSTVKSEFKLNNKLLEYGRDYIGSAALNDSGMFKGQKLVFAGYGISDSNYNDYLGVDAKGKIVVFFLGEPRRDSNYIVSGKKRGSQWTYPGLARKLAAAKQKGAIGALVINPAQASFSQKTIESSKKTGLIFKSIPVLSNSVSGVILSHEYAGMILGNAFDSLLAAVKVEAPLSPGTVRIGDEEVLFNHNEIRTTVEASNVIGVVEGTDKKEEYVFITAHYDHLGIHNGKTYYGADDDGSGTCGVIEMAEAFSKAKAAGKGPRRTMVFMTVSGEEKGLWGSEYYSDHPVFPLENTSVDLNIDMVGRIDTERKTGDTLNYIYVIGHDKISSDLPVINEGVNNKYTKLVFDYKFDDPADPNRIYYRSDHYNFARKGVPILFFYDGMLEADYHQPSDTVDKIYWELYEKRVRMIFHTAWEIANRDAMLKRDIPLQTGER